MAQQSGILAPQLERWAQLSGHGELRAVVVRLVHSADPALVADELRELGASVNVVGSQSVACVVTPGQLLRLAQQPWVVAVEESRRMFPSPGRAKP